MTSPIHYPIVVHNVREVGIYGSADLAYWRARLGAYALHPFQRDGHAHIFVNATSLKWKSIPSRECIISIALSQNKDGGTEDGAFLLHAFNSRWFFALVERRSFASPYYHAAIDSETDPPRFQVRTGGQTPITAARRDHAAGTVSHQSWVHPIFLPPRTQNHDAPRKYFFAKLSGETLTTPFAAEDEFALKPLASIPVIQQLLDSNFTPREWHIRTDATHSKSNTFTVGEDVTPPRPTPPAASSE